MCPPAGYTSGVPIRAVACLALLVVTAAAVAACGSSGGSGTSTGSAANPEAARQFLAFSQCMRTHGVPKFPDPSSGGGIQLSAASGINPASPAFRAAQHRCQKLLPGGGPGNQHPSAQRMKQALATSDCMRRHGITGFPDPTTHAPASPVGYSIVEDSAGVVIAVPASIDPNSPAFRRAGSACGFH